MIVGNPSLFAIQFDVVPEWSTPRWSNGTFTIYVANIRAGSNQIRAEDINTQFWQLIGSCDLHQLQPVLSEETLKKSAEEIFTFLEELTFPKIDIGQDDCSQFLAASSAVTEMDYSVFLVRFKLTERLYIGHRTKGLEATVDLPIGEFKRIVSLGFEKFSHAH